MPEVSRRGAVAITAVVTLVITSAVKTDFRACSGAVAADLTTVAQLHHGVPNHYGIQLGSPPSSALGTDLGLVTLSVGGNDANFAKVLDFCIRKTSCEDRTYLDGLTLRDWAAQKVPTIVHDAGLIYRLLKDGAPKARVIVLGYPHLFPETTPSGSATCKVVAAGYKRDERDFIRSTESALNGALEAEALDAGVEFLQTKWLFQGHEECGRLGPWLNSLKLPIVGYSFHPNKIGQREYADLISCYLQLHPDRPTATHVKEGGDTVSLPGGSSGGSLEDTDLLSCARGTPQ